MTEKQKIKELGKEKVSVRKIEISEMTSAPEQDRDIFLERVQEFLNKILEKYECVLYCSEGHDVILSRKTKGG